MKKKGKEKAPLRKRITFRFTFYAFQDVVSASSQSGGITFTD
jgi:hypothetical protein